MRLVNRDDPIEFLPSYQRRVILTHQASSYVELAPIFKQLDIRVEMTKMPDSVSGETSYARGSSPSGFFVRINQSQSMVRRRFTAAHELGHCLLHGAEIKKRAREEDLLGVLNRSSDPEFCDLLGEFIPDPFADVSEQRQEIEANRFAGALLMPAPTLNKLWRSGVREPEALARCVGVSPQALRRRLRELETRV
ncbi:MAG TPA: ImmA/IrrE family metallo-endopeptidase [Paracoccaceae bacterium]|nr:ImmA/IrrE family metallo-endopeptidase [Paracoccaceae bacterium]